MHVWSVPQAYPHVPQLPSSVYMFVSQPFTLFPSQLFHPSSQYGLHSPLEHVFAPFSWSHVPQLPSQLSVPHSLPSQSMTQSPSWHTPPWHVSGAVQSPHVPHPLGEDPHSLVPQSGCSVPLHSPPHPSRHVLPAHAYDAHVQLAVQFSSGTVLFMQYPLRHS